MAATISKIGILVGLDTTGLAGGAAKAETVIQGLGQRITQFGSGSAGGDSLRGSFQGANAAIKVMQGNLGSIAPLLTNLTAGAVALGAAFGAARLAAWGIRMASAQDSDFQARWKLFKDEIADLAIKIGKFFLPVLKEWLTAATGLIQLIKGGAATPGTYDKGTNPEGWAAKQKEMADKALEVQKKLTAEMEKQARLINDSIIKQNQAWMDVGKRITEEFRTPGEVLNQRIGELNFLANRGLITFETYSRAINKAADDFAEMGTKAKQFKQITNTENAALDRFTTAGFSATREASDKWNQLKEIQKQQLDEERKANRKRDEILRAIQDGGTKVKEVTF